MFGISAYALVEIVGSVSIVTVWVTAYCLIWRVRRKAEHAIRSDGKQWELRHDPMQCSFCARELHRRLANHGF